MPPSPDSFDRSYEVARTFSIVVLDMLIPVCVLNAVRELTLLRAVAVERGFLSVSRRPAAFQRRSTRYGRRSTKQWAP